MQASFSQSEEVFYRSHITIGFGDLIISWSKLILIGPIRVCVVGDICFCLKTVLVSLTLCIFEIPKRELLQTVKTQMKCSIMLHFIRVYTVCKGKKDLETKEYNIFLKL